MKILALESSAAACSVALFEDDNCICNSFTPMIRGQAEAMIPMVETLMQKHKEDYKTIDYIATSIGPGAFTGLRIAIAAAKGFALAIEKPLIGISSLKTIAAAAKDKAQSTDTNNKKPIFVIADTRRKDFYIASFDHNLNPLKPESAISGEDLQSNAPDSDYILTGDAIEKAKNFLNPKNYTISPASPLPDALFVAKLALEEIKNNQKDWLPPPISPAYLRPADAICAKNLRQIANRPSEES